MNAIATQAAQAIGERRHMTKREALKASADRIAAQRDAVRATIGVTKGAPLAQASTPATKAPAVKRANKGGRIASMSPNDRAREIRELLRDLHDASDSDEKKRIRRALRARDHWGGARGADSVDDTLKAKAPAERKGRQAPPVASVIHKAKAPARERASK